MLNVEINMISWYNNFFNLRTGNSSTILQDFEQRNIEPFLQKKKLTISKQAFDVPLEINKKKNDNMGKKKKEI